MLAVGYPNLDGKEWIYWVLQMTLVSLMFYVYFSYCKIQKSFLLNICLPLRSL